MKAIEARLQALEDAYKKDIESRLSDKPCAWIQVYSITEQDILITYYPGGIGKVEKVEHRTDFDGFVQWVSRMSYKVETFVSHSQSTEYLFSLLLTDRRELAGGNDAKQRIIQEWLEKYPYLQRYVDEPRLADDLASLKPQANISAICRRVKKINSHSI